MGRKKFLIVISSDCVRDIQYIDELVYYDKENNELDYDKCEWKDIDNVEVTVGIIEANTSSEAIKIAARNYGFKEEILSAYQLDRCGNE